MNDETPRRFLRVLSLGAGVQSTTVALMMARGEIEPVDVAIFADTMSEPASVYRHLDALAPQLPFPVEIVSHGDLAEEILATAYGSGRNDGRPPFYVRGQDGKNGGMLRRQCTSDFKIDIIRKKIRELLGLRPGQRMPDGYRAHQFMGISLDEAGRMKLSGEPWLVNRYPLVEHRLTRWDCEQWLRRNGHRVPDKSACVFCPYRRDHEWRALRDNSPEDFARAVEIDEAIRSPRYVEKVGECYAHRSMVPLSMVDLSTPAEAGQMNLWEDECDGHCGV